MRCGRRTSKIDALLRAVWQEQYREFLQLDAPATVETIFTTFKEKVPDQVRSTILSVALGHYRCRGGGSHSCWQVDSPWQDPEGPIRHDELIKSTLVKLIETYVFVLMSNSKLTFDPEEILQSPLEVPKWTFNGDIVKGPIGNYVVILPKLMSAEGDIHCEAQVLKIQELRP